MEFMVVCQTCEGKRGKNENVYNTDVLYQTSVFVNCTDCNGKGYTDPPQQILDDLECAEIERELLKNNVGVSYYMTPDYSFSEAFTIMLYPKKIQNITSRGRNKIEANSKIEALRKAKEWIEGRV